MRITSKASSSPSHSPKEVKAVNVTPAQLKEYYQESLMSTVPYGKYKGRTYKWLKDNDPKYMVWLADNELLIDWGYYVWKDTKPIVKRDVLYTDDGVWMQLYEIANNPPYNKCEWI